MTEMWHNQPSIRVYSIYKPLPCMTRMLAASSINLGTLHNVLSICHQSYGPPTPGKIPKPTHCLQYYEMQAARFFSIHYEAHIMNRLAYYALAFAQAKGSLHPNERFTLHPQPSRCQLSTVERSYNEASQRSRNPWCQAIGMHQQYPAFSYKARLHHMRHALHGKRH